MMKPLIIALGIALMATTPAKASAACGIDEIAELETVLVNDRIVTRSTCTKMLCKGSIVKEFCERVARVERAMEQGRRNNHHAIIKEIAGEMR